MNRRVLVGGVGAAVALAVAVASFSSVSVRATEPAPVTAQGEQVNLGSAEGARNFYARIEQAANATCATVQAVEPCVEAEIARAVREVNSPALTQVYIELNARPAADNVIVLGKATRLARS